jgi:hypothetical protein
MSEKRKDAALWSLVFVVLMEAAAFCFWLGKLSERVDAVQETTKVLLQMQLEKTQRGAR